MVRVNTANTNLKFWFINRSVRDVDIQHRLECKFYVVGFQGQLFVLRGKKIGTKMQA